MKAQSRLLWCAGLGLLGIVSLGLWLAREKPRSRATGPVVDAAPSVTAPTAAPAVSPSVSSAPAPVPAASSAVSPLDAFKLWAEQYAAAPPEGRGALLAGGEKLAAARRAEMARLIQSDPAEALAQALPYKLRKALPGSILAQIEQPVSGRGEFKAVYSTPPPGGGVTPRTEYEVILHRRAYAAYTYGPRLQQPSRKGVVLHGIAVTEPAADGRAETPLMAVSPAAGRVLEAEEAQDAIADGRAKADPVCGVTGETVPAVAAPALVEFGENLYPFCRPVHAAHFNAEITRAQNDTRLWNAAGFTPASHTGDPLPPEARSATQGIKKLLYMRVLFADDPVPPQDEDGAQAQAKATDQYFYDNSYGTVSLKTTVTPLIRLPQKRNYYGELFKPMPTQARIFPETAAMAATMGYFVADYDFAYVLFNVLPQAGYGGRSDGLLNGSPGALTHEIGHNFGLGHAYSWDPSGRFPPRPVPLQWPVLLPVDPDSVVGHSDINAANNGLTTPAPFQDYGDPYDVMGSGPGHFGAVAKWVLNWLPDHYVKHAKASTTNRVFAFDTPRLISGRTYAVRIHKDFQPSLFGPLEREYWVSYRQGFAENPWASGGVQIHWNYGGINTLLDTTYETSYSKQDAAVVVGRTFSDIAAGLHFTPIAQGGGPDPWDKWIDVVTHKGPFPLNQPPVVDFQASGLTVTNGATVTFTVTAQDPDGDALAYHWDFGDHSFGLNTNVMSKTFTTNAQYVVRIEVSDMKGGLTSAHVVVTVGNPTTFSVSGRVLDIYGNPVANARVHNSGVLPPPDTPVLPDGIQTNSTVTQLGTYRYAYTDSQGYYTIGNIPPGIYTNRCFRYGYRTSPFNFGDPLSLTNGNAENFDFIARPLPRVTVRRTSDASENGVTNGIFTLTRDGDLGADLRVRYFLSGPAVMAADYQVPPGNFFTNPVNMAVTSNTVGFVTIPAGSNTATVPIRGIPDTTGFGPLDARLTILHQTGEVRIVTVLTNVLTTNGPVVITNTMFVNRTNAVRIPGWEVLEYGPTNALTWFQTDPTYIFEHGEATLRISDDEPAAQPSVAVLGLQTILTVNIPTGENYTLAGDSDAVETRGDNAMLVFVRLGAPIDQPLTINYTLSGAAVNGVDFVELPGVVTIPAGETYMLVPVIAINDLFVEGNEELTVSIAAGGYTVIPGFEQATLVIAEDDLPLVSVYAADSVTGDSAGNGVVTVSRTGTLDRDLLVNYLVTGTATSGQDFQTLPGSVTIPAGLLTADIVITPINNPTSILPKTVTILLSDSPAYNIYNQNEATVTIVDLALPIVTLETLVDSIPENNGVGSFRVRRTGPLTNSLVVSFSVGGTAWEGADYAAIGTNVVIPAGSATTNITIQAINDPFRERGDVSGFDDILIQLQPAPAYLLGDLFGGRTWGEMRIEDDDPGDLPAVGFMLGASSIREDEGPAVLWLKCSANVFADRPITVDYRITGGSGVLNVNYRPIPGVTGFVNFFTNVPPPANLEGQVVPIVISNINDNLAAGNKTIIVTLFNPTRFTTNVVMTTNTMTGQVFTSTNIFPVPTNAYIANAVSHTLTLIDVGVTTVTITPLTAYASEAGPELGRFSLTRTGPTNQPLAVAFKVTGTAASGSDFAALGSNGVFVIPAGTNQTVIDLIPLDDPTEETTESVIVTLLERQGYSVGNPGSATILLSSDDGTLQFTSESYRVLENAGPAVVSVLRTGDTNLAVSVDYQFIDGTANNPLDYLGTNGTVFFAPGETVQTISVPLVDDQLVEDAETFTVVLSNPSGGVPLGGQFSTTVFIDNDDTAFVFSTNVFYVNEHQTTGQVTVTRQGFTNLAASVRLATADITARATNDYVGTNVLLNFAPGVTSVVASVRILNDTNFEGDETVALSLSSPSANASVGVLSNSSLVIVDDEFSVEFLAPNFDVAEYAGFAQVVVHRNGGTVHPFSVTFSTRNGTASNAVDYTAVTRVVNFRGDALVLDTNGSGALFFQPGDRDITVLVPILDDVIGEGNETFFVRLNGLSGPGGLPAATFFLTTGTNSTVTILDNELPGNADYEYNTSIGANATVRGLAFQSDQKTVFVGDFTTVNNIAFNRVARLQVSGLLDPSFNPGAGANDSVFAVAAQPDNRVLVGGLFTTFDGLNRNRIARLSADGNIDVSFNPGTGPNNNVRAIAVQPDGRIVIAGEFTSVNGTNRSYLARLNASGSLDLSFNANVNNPVYAVALQPDGKVVAGGAFTAAGGTNRNFLARLNSDGSADVTFDTSAGFNNNVHSVAVQSDGRILVGGLFTTYGTTNRAYLARLLADASLDGSFNIASGPNGAVHTVSVQPNGKIFIGGDFTTYNGASRNFFTRLRADGMPDSLFNVGSGANGSVRASVIQQNSAIVIGGDFTTVQGISRGRIARIHGDEKSNITGVEFASAVFQVVENLGPAIVSVVRTGNTNSAFTVQFATSAGTATSLLDYTNRTGTLTFAAGVTVASFSVPIVNDSLFELDETVFLRLTNASNPAIDLSGQTNATLFIVDDEKGVQFGTNNFFVAEEATNAVITVVRSGSLNGGASVIFRASAGTATSGVDFIGVTNTLVFTNGEAVKTILIPIIDENIAEADETVQLTLVAPTGAATNVPFVATLTIVNTDQAFGTFTFDSTNRINILDGAPALPYPSTINVSGLTGIISRVAVTLVGLTHTFPDDIDMLLTGPNGANVVFMSDAGGSFDVFGATVRFDDRAPFFLPDDGQIFSGSYKPTDFPGGDSFTAPAPATNMNGSFAAYAGSAPNGAWSLYVVDDRGNDVGEVLNGWRLEITTVNPATVTDTGITMTDSPDPVMAGNQLTWLITVTNAGPLPASGVVVTNPLPPYVNFVSVATTQGACANNAGVVSCALGSLAVNGSAQITLRGTPLIAGLLTNTATVTAAQPDVTPLNSSATAVTTVTPAPVADLNLGISDAPDPIFAGSNITYTVSLTNNGPLTASGVVFSDALPPTLGFVSAVSSIGSCGAAGNTVSCNLGDMASGARATITIIARALGSGQLTNIVTASSGTPDLTPASAFAVTTVQGAANLFVYQLESADPTPIGNPLTYTIVVTNLGVSTATGVNLVDTLPSGATFISAFPSQGSCAAVAGLLLCDLGSISNGGAVLVSIDVVPNSLLPLINSVNVTALDFDPNPTNNLSTEVTTTIALGTGLIITPTTNAVTLAQAVTAAGATGIQITSVDLQAHQTEGATSSGLFQIGAPPPTYGLTQPGIVLSTGNVDDYETGPNTQTGFTFGYGVPATLPQEMLLDPITRSGTNDFNHFDVTQLDIQFDMQPGFDRVEFRVVFGSEEWPEFVDDLFIDGFGIYLNGANIAFTAGLPVNINHPAMRSLPGTELDGILAPGGNAILTFTANVPPGSVSNRLTFIVADTTDSILDTTVYISSLQGGAGPNTDMAVALTVTPEPVFVGSNLTCNITVQNRGPGDATGVIVSGPIPPGVNFLGAAPTQGSCVVSNGTLLCALGAMNRSTAAGITLTLQPLGSGRLTNAFTVRSDLADFRPTNDFISVVSTVVDPGAFISTDALLIADAQPGLPYPSVIRVAGLAGVVGKVTVSLVELSHSFPADIDVLLAGPSGQKVMLMSDAGGATAVNGITLRFDDDAAIRMPQLGQLANGSYRPSDFEPGDVLASPAPAGPYAGELAEFFGTSPNGDWSLYVADDRGVDSGVIAGGWRLNIQTVPGEQFPTLTIARVPGSLVISWPDRYGNYALETTSALGAGAVWSPVGVAPVLGGGNYTVTLTPGGAGAFYRLRAP